MRVNVIMPQLGESVAEGTILKWLKQVGDKIQKDENILEISTDKVDSEIPSLASGILVEILAQEGATVPVNQPIAVIETEVEKAVIVAKPTIKPAPKEKAISAPATQPETTVFRKPVVTAPIPSAGSRFYSPLVRSISQTEGITEAELDSIVGSGINGRVTKKDLEEFIARKKSGAPIEIIKPTKATTVSALPLRSTPTPPPTLSVGEEIIPMDVMRKRIAEHMVRSAYTAPHVTSVSEADMTSMVQFRESSKKSFEAREGFKLTYTPIIIEVVIKTLKEYPYLNASLDGDNIILKHYINIGVAVALESGLIVPVIKGADGMNLLALARAVNDLSSRARTKRLSPDDVHGSTFSVTNPGVFGNLIGTPIINQPNVAILGLGAIVKRPVVIAGDAIVIRSMMYLSLSYDHRLIDGAHAGQFLQRIVHYLEAYDSETTI
ncbi:MAG: dihydrolipoamide acetyltransferase family protein [bacterium]